MQRQVFVKNEEIIPHERFNQNPLPGCGRMTAVIKKMFKEKMEGMCFKLTPRSHLNKFERGLEMAGFVISGINIRC